MRPIDADALLEQYDQLFSEYVPNDMKQMIDSMYLAIINAPTLTDDDCDYQSEPPCCRGCDYYAFDDGESFYCLYHRTTFQKKGVFDCVNKREKQ